MRLRNIRGSREAIEASSHVVNHEEGLAGTWHERFGNNHPIHLEIGMGKGQFLVESARRNPNINYIGIERYSSVLYRAVQKVEGEELENLRFLYVDAGKLLEVFARGEVHKIYLHFSDPWPKDRHARRRLNSKEYLALYQEILASEGVLELKTDNQPLFEFGLEQVEEAKWTIQEHTHHLHTKEYLQSNPVMTEYQQKFGDMGNPIYQYVIAP
ncbi:MAG: tRNA (guanosine(46)-N7)-methyltransferase TrmB [Eubacteriales bacterium]